MCSRQASGWHLLDMLSCLCTAEPVLCDNSFGRPPHCYWQSPFCSFSCSFRDFLAKSLLAFMGSYIYWCESNKLACHLIKSIHKNHNNPSDKRPHSLMIKRQIPTKWQSQFSPIWPFPMGRGRVVNGRLPYLIVLLPFGHFHPGEAGIVKRTPHAKVHWIRWDYHPVWPPCTEIPLDRDPPAQRPPRQGPL